MSLRNNATALGGVALAMVMAAGLGGCGKKGVLETPAPLFGERAKEDYAARQAAASAAATDAHANAPVAAADRPDPDADNAPRTTRDIQDPAENNVPITQQAIPGANDLMGPTPSLKPPGR